MWNKLFARREPPSSIERQIARLDELHRVAEEFRASYLAAVEAICRSVPVPVCRNLGAFRDEFGEARRMATGAESTEQLGALRRSFDGLLKRYGKALEAQLRFAENEAREIVAKFSEMAESIARRDREHSVRFRGIAKKLRLLATCDDLSEIKAKLGEEIEELDRSVSDVSRENEEAVGRLKSQVEEIEERRRLAVPLPARPSLPGREEALAWMTGMSAGAGNWGVAMFAVEQSPQGAEALARLGAAFKPPDNVYLWSDRKLLVVRAINVAQLADLAERSMAGAGCRAPVCHYGVAGYIKGEKVEALIDRVESLTSAGPLRRPA